MTVYHEYPGLIQASGTIATNVSEPIPAVSRATMRYIGPANVTTPGGAYLHIPAGKYADIRSDGHYTLHNMPMSLLKEEAKKRQEILNEIDRYLNTSSVNQEMKARMIKALWEGQQEANQEEMMERQREKRAIAARKLYETWRPSQKLELARARLVAFRRSGRYECPDCGGPIKATIAQVVDLCCLGRFHQSLLQREKPNITPLETTEQAGEALARHFEETNHPIAESWQDAPPPANQYPGISIPYTPIPTPQYECEGLDNGLNITEERVREGWTAPVRYKFVERAALALDGPDMTGDDVARDMSSSEIRAFYEAQGDAC